MQTLGKVGAQSIIFTWTGREFDLFLASGDNLDAEIFCIKVLGRERTVVRAHIILSVYI